MSQQIQVTLYVLRFHRAPGEIASFHFEDPEHVAQAQKLCREKGLTPDYRVINFYPPDATLYAFADFEEWVQEIVPTVDELVRRHSAFKSLQDLLQAAGNYRPSLNVKNRAMGKELARIADAYDSRMAEIGDERRAYRY